MKLLLPDACWNKAQISGALFLYLRDEGIGFTLHPSVSTVLTGIDPFDFFKFVETRRPPWSSQFFTFVSYWSAYQTSLRQTSDLLKPLHKGVFKTILLSYDRGAHAWESAMEVLSSSRLPPNQIAASIDRFSASDELFSHIFFEKYLELYLPHEDMFALGMDAAKKLALPGTVSVSWQLLYDYCDQLFTGRNLEELLTIAYMFRMPIIKDKNAAFLLSNERLITFLASLPVASPQQESSMGSDDRFDIAAWEFFRQLVSPMADPLTKERVDRLCTLIHERPNEIERLKRRCLSLALELGKESELDLLQNRIKTHIRVNVEKDIQDFLDLDRRTVDDFLDLAFTDEKVWAGISTLLLSLTQGGPTLTAGAAIYALSTVGSKVVKAAANRRDKIQASDFALLYRMKGL